MWFFWEGPLYQPLLIEGDEIRDPAKFKHKYWNLYITMLWLYNVRAGAVKFPKKADFEPYHVVKKYTTFFFSSPRHRALT